MKLREPFERRSFKFGNPVVLHAGGFSGSLQTHWTIRNGVDIRGRSGENVSPQIVRCAMRRLRSLGVPRHWSAHEWKLELHQVASIAAWQASREFESSDRVPLAVFVFHRVRARGLALYRKEWRYGRRFVFELVESAGDETDDGGEPGLRRVTACCERNPVHEALREAVAALPEPLRRIIELRFWQGHVETEIAGLLGISQRTVNNRKHAALKLLRAALLELQRAEE